MVDHHTVCWIKGMMRSKLENRSKSTTSKRNKIYSYRYVGSWCIEWIPHWNGISYWYISSRSSHRRWQSIHQSIIFHWHRSTIEGVMFAHLRMPETTTTTTTKIEDSRTVYLTFCTRNGIRCVNVQLRQNKEEKINLKIRNIWSFFFWILSLSLSRSSGFYVSTITPFLKLFKKR